MEEIITMDHGSGGLATSALIDEIIVPAFAGEGQNNPQLEALADGAVVDVPACVACASVGDNGQSNPLPKSAHPANTTKLVMSTDSFVISPFRFPDANIGKLSVCGTVNDICMAGGRPLYLTMSLIIEEGFKVSDLKEIVASAARTAREAGVKIVTGDTKVVDHGHGDGIFINTAGVGVMIGPALGKDKIQTGDSVIMSGDIGRHGAAIMMERTGLLECTECDDDTNESRVTSNADGKKLNSDCMCLNELSVALFKDSNIACNLRILRDPTRGGVATTLNEFFDGDAAPEGLSIMLDENKVPVASEVKSACNLLGIDPLYSACEGRMIVICSSEAENKVLATLRGINGGENACKIGSIFAPENVALAGKVLLRTELGATRILNKLAGAQLPRIC